MKDHNNYIIEAIELFTILYPDYKIDFILFWGVRDNMIIFRINGIKGDKVIIDTIKIDL